jgi:hypothetical protein
LFWSHKGHLDTKELLTITTCRIVVDAEEV